MDEKHEKGRGKKFLNIIFIIIELILIAFFAISMVFSNKTATPSLFGYSFYLMQGNGMESAIPENSLVVVKNGDIPETGYAVLCNLIEGEHVTVLRIVGTDETNGETTYLMKSDAKGMSEVVKVEPAKIIGQATYSLDAVGKIISFVKSQAGVLVIIVIPSGIILISILISILSKVKDEDEEKEDSSEDEDDEINEENEIAKENEEAIEEAFETKEKDNVVLPHEKEDSTKSDEEKQLVKAAAFTVDEDGKAAYNNIKPTADIKDLENTLISRPKNQPLPKKPSQEKSTKEKLEELMKYLDNQAENNK